MFVVLLFIRNKKKNYNYGAVKYGTQSRRSADIKSASLFNFRVVLHVFVIIIFERSTCLASDDDLN
jgi:hypothetical protein